MHNALYEFCRDQGSIIGGLLALAAGYLAFRGATRAAAKQVAAVNAQTEALRQQNSDLKTEARRRSAGEAIIAIKLLESVAAIVRRDVAKVTTLLDQPHYFGPNRVVPTNVRQLIYQLPLDIVWGNLGVCSAEMVTNYLLLDARLDEFAHTRIYSVDVIQNELQTITDILDRLDSELESHAARCNAVLLETSRSE
jgi:uncharacterized membrane-anchored protein YhcB (DUF1043 family)